MDILIWALLGVLFASTLAFIIWFLCLLCNLNSDKLNLCTKMTMYSLLLAVISFLCILLITAS